MPTNAQYGGPLVGLDAELAALPFGDPLRGGIDAGSVGTHDTPGEPALPPGAVGGARNGAPAAPGAPPNGQPNAPVDPLAGVGPLFDADDAKAFKHVDALVRRQEQLAKNRYAQDLYWTCVKKGWGHLFSLEKAQDKGVWKCEVAPGVNALALRPVPNDADDICNKVVETLNVDPPRPEAQAMNDSEEAERAAEVAREFLERDGGESGTRDARLFWKACGSATSCSANYLVYSVDKTGGGSVPLQIQAHPEAQDPRTPLVCRRPDPSGAIGPDGQPLTFDEPTTSPVLRYVATDAEGNPTHFVEDGAQAGHEWQPKIVIERYKREHIRTFPEHADVGDADIVVGLFWTTVGRAKYRWPDVVGPMTDAQLTALVGWLPLRSTILLPAAQRTRGQQQEAGADDLEGGANDERVVFYYRYLRKPCPLYPKGADIAVSGANNGTVLGTGVLSALVPSPDGKGQEPKALDIPVVQIDLIGDEDDDDPSGKALISRFGGSTEASAALMSAFLEAIDIVLHPATYATATSPVSGDDVVQSRATGDHIPVLSKEDFPMYEEPRQLPADFLNIVEYLREKQDSAAGTSKAAQGAERQQEVSGVARSIAVRQALVSLARMQQSVNEAWQRHWRIKTQMAQSSFTTPQMIRYEGEDGAYKVEWWTGADFSHVSDVTIAPGTGTLFPPQDKLQFITSMMQQGYVSADDAADAARPTFARTLGVPENRQLQRVERQVGAWLKGPPDPTWVPKAQALAQYQQSVAPVQQQYQQVAQQAASVGAPPPPPPQLPPAPQAPWTPFGRLPMDLDPPIALVRKRRLADLMASPRFAAQPPEWQKLVADEYVAMSHAAAPPPPPMPGAPNGAPGAPPNGAPKPPQGGPGGQNGPQAITPNDAAHTAGSAAAGRPPGAAPTPNGAAPTAPHQPVAA